jgi:hypothetical protein
VETKNCDAPSCNISSIAKLVMVSSDDADCTANSPVDS